MVNTTRGPRSLNTTWDWGHQIQYGVGSQGRAGGLEIQIPNRNKTLSVEEYFKKIRPYLKDIINNLKKSDTLKIQLTIAINFKDDDKERVMHSKNDNIKIIKQST